MRHIAVFAMFERCTASSHADAGAVIMKNGGFAWSPDEANPHRLVVGKFWDQIPTTGNSRFHAATVAHVNATDGDYFFGLGYAEGYLTAERISQQIYNRVRKGAKVSPRVWHWIRKNNMYIRKQVAANQLSDPYWFNLQLHMVRLDGILAGYHTRRAAQRNLHLDEKVNLLELLMINAVSDIEDIGDSMNRRIADEDELDMDVDIDSLEKQLEQWEEQFQSNKKLSVFPGEIHSDEAHMQRKLERQGQQFHSSGVRTT